MAIGPTTDYPPSRLAVLDLSFNPWDWRCSAANGTLTQFFLGPGARLRQLDLSHTGMDCSGALGLVAALQASGNRALATINLDHNAIGNAGCHALGSLLGAADYRLSSFTIGWNNIGDDGLGSLLRNGVRDLSVLGLHGNGLCAPAAVTLSRVLGAARNPRPRRLNQKPCQAVPTPPSVRPRPGLAPAAPRAARGGGGRGRTGAPLWPPPLRAPPAPPAPPVPRPRAA